MEQYTIYCTEEQTKKALELGAPIEESPMVDIIRNEIGNRCLLCGSNVCWYPTAEQMIGWLEEQDIALDIHTYFSGDSGKINHYQFTVTDLKRVFIGTYSSRKEATLAAIDAALDYLIKMKK